MQRSLLLLVAVFLLFGVGHADTCTSYWVYNSSVCEGDAMLEFNTGKCLATAWVVKMNGNTYSGSSVMFSATSSQFQMYTDAACRTLRFTETGVTCNQCGIPNGWTLSLGGRAVKSSQSTTLSKFRLGLPLREVEPHGKGQSGVGLGIVLTRRAP